MAFTGEIVPGRGMLKVNGKSVIVCDSLGVAVIFEVFWRGTPLSESLSSSGTIILFVACLAMLW